MTTSVHDQGREIHHQRPEAGRNSITARHTSSGTVALYAFRHDGEVILVNLEAEDALAIGQWLVEKAEEDRSTASLAYDQVLGKPQVDR